MITRYFSISRFNYRKSHSSAQVGIELCSLGPLELFATVPDQQEAMDDQIQTKAANVYFAP